jgi:hypothetical protein
MISVKQYNDLIEKLGSKVPTTKAEELEVRIYEAYLNNRKYGLSEEEAIKKAEELRKEEHGK